MTPFIRNIGGKNARGIYCKDYVDGRFESHYHGSSR